MSSPLPGLMLRHRLDRDNDRIEYNERHTELRRILAFAGWSIDDVINNPIARRDVRNWYKTGRWMQRQIEIGDLERQWNPLK
jgi:hypothetical protein